MSWHSYRSKHTHCLAALILNYSSLPCNPKPPLPGKGQAVPTSKLFLCNLERNIPQVLLFIVFSASQNSRIYGTRAPNLQRRTKLTLKLRPSGKNKHLTTKIVSFPEKRVCVCYQTSLFPTALLLLPLSESCWDQQLPNPGGGEGMVELRACTAPWWDKVHFQGSAVFASVGPTDVSYSKPQQDIDKYIHIYIYI